MVEHHSQSPKEPAQSTEYGIPIRNLWHILLYAWNEVPLNAMRGWAMEAVERAPTLDALLATILMKLMHGRLRIGLGHDYVNEGQTLQGIRGRLDFSESLKRHAFERSEAYCEFQAYSANSLKNQIIRSTLAKLVQAGQFGPFDKLRTTPEADSVKELRQKLRRLTRELDGIDLIEVTPDMIRRQQSLRNDQDYRLMLSICDLILQRQMPAGSEDRSTSVVPVIDRDALVLYNIYERFIANFYLIHLQGWDVKAQKRLEWHAKHANEYLPLMVPDLILQEKSSGQLMILDTKFTAHSLVENQWGKPIFDSSHLYQLYAYLKSQEHLSEAHHTATGILLYPAIQYKFSEKVELQDHVIRIECVDLAAPWQEIEKDLLDLVSRVG